MRAIAITLIGLVLGPLGSLAVHASPVQFQAKPDPKNEKLEEVIIKDRSGRVVEKHHRKNGKIHGPVEVYWSDGNLKTKGQYTDGKKTGLWTVWPLNSKEKYEVEMADDKRNGSYTSYYFDGSVEWSGRFKDDKATGEWTRSYQAGGVWEHGAMLDGLREGTWKVEDGSEGKYLKGKKQGSWRRVGTDGKTLVEEGSYVDDMKDGIWVRYWEDGKSKYSEYEFSAGRQLGRFSEWYKNGQPKVEGHYGPFGFDGGYTAWHENGQISERRSYKAGKLVGRGEGFFDDGQKAFEADYDKGSQTVWSRNGKKAAEDTGGPDGTSTIYYESGSKQIERKRKKGVAVLETEYWESGQKKAEGPTHEKDRSKRDGKWKFWYETGEKLFEGEMCLYGRTGKWTEYHKNGKKKSEGLWFSAFDKLENKVIEVQILKWTWWDEEGKQLKTEEFPDPRREKLPGK